MTYQRTLARVTLAGTPEADLEFTESYRCDGTCGLVQAGAGGLLIVQGMIHHLGPGGGPSEGLNVHLCRACAYQRPLAMLLDRGARDRLGLKRP